jgi:diguanylate cyclase (GGDEF)-like protein
VTEYDRHKAAFKELFPFALTAVIGWVTVTIGAQIDWTRYWESLVLLIAVWIFGLMAGLRGHLRSGTVIGSIGFLTALALLRASSGGLNAGVSSLTLLPVFQTALRVRSRQALLVVLLCLVPFYLMPLILVGPPMYPHVGYRSALLSLAAASIIGLVTQSLVTDIRRRATEARQREEMLVRVNATVQQLVGGPQTRSAVCSSIRDISEATFAVLIEQELGTKLLRYTAVSPDDQIALTELEVADGEIVRRALRSGELEFTNPTDADSLGTYGDLSDTHPPRSLLYMPLVNKNSTIGVLVAGWSEPLRQDDPRVSLSRLMAVHMAGVIDQADVIDQLTGEALTDALTGLPNRRAWNLRLADALSRGNQLAVAMFDIDHFKNYNDSFGHPAGDSLLARIAAGWQSELRRGDFLARLGGEEFGLLLPGADRLTAERVVERLRRSMPDEETCSAGIALMIEDDQADQLVGRADKALYEAKASGRDVAVVMISDGLEMDTLEPVPHLR